MHYLCAGIPHLHNVEGEEEKTEKLVCMGYFRISWVNRLVSNNTLTLPGHQRGSDATLSGLSLPALTPSFVFSRHSPDCVYPLSPLSCVYVFVLVACSSCPSVLCFCAWSPVFLTLGLIRLSMLILHSYRCCLAFFVPTILLIFGPQPPFESSHFRVI